MANEEKGMFTELMEASREPSNAPPPRPKKAPEATRPIEQVSSPTGDDTLTAASEQEDLSTIPYMAQNYRFTEDELKWLRRQAYDLTETLGAKVPQNLVVRIAVHHLRQVVTKNPKNNPLLEAISKLRK